MRNMLLALLLCPGLASAQTVLQQFSAVSSGAGTVSDMDLPEPTASGSVLITMPLQLTPGVRVIEVTDNAPGGGNTYKQFPGTYATCQKQALEIWFCENCKPGVTELKIHLSGHVRVSLNTFLEVSGLVTDSTADGNGVPLTDGSASNAGLERGPKLTTSVKDFVIARFFSDPTLPSGVTPDQWHFTKSYAYVLNGPEGDYQPMFTGAKPGSNYCAGLAAFKVASRPDPQMDH